MNDRLTPKPGDWVMVDGRQFDDGKNRFGTVVERGAYASGDEVTVELDVSGKHYCQPQNVTVVKSVSSALTPRVGDRVIVKLSGKTYAGNVVTHMNEDGEWLVEIDGNPVGWYRRTDEIEVRDREPVDWPEGWRTHDSPHERAVLSVPGGYAHILSKIEIEKILEDGPYILEHWDELIRNDA